MTYLRLLLVSISCLASFLYAQSPVANFTATPLVVCVGQNVNFTNTSSANGGPALSSYQWDFGDGNSALSTNATHAFSTAGTFTITLVATNANGVADAEIKPAYITVNPLPNVNFSANGLGCTVPLTLSFNNTSSQGANFAQAWNFGNSQTSTQYTPPSITYNSQGTFQVVLTVTNNNTGCVNSLTQPIVVSNFQAGITAPTTGCVGQAISFQDNSTAGANAWSWNFGTAGQSNAENPNVTYNSPGTYTVNLTSQNTNSGCSASTSQQIVIQANTIPNFYANPTANCAPGSIQFFNTTNLTGTYVWNFGDGQTYTGTNPPAHLYQLSGLYDVSLTFTSSAGCSGTKTLQDYIEITPVLAGFYALDTGGCAPLTAQFIDTSYTPSNPIVSWQWNFGNGQTFNGQVPPPQTYGVGLYDISLIITTASGCSDTLLKPSYITVGAIDSIDFTWDPNITCANTDVEFESEFYISVPYDSTEISYLWDFSQGISTQDDPTFQFSQDTGWVDVTLYVNFRGCIDTLEKDSVLYVLAPIAQFNPDAYLVCNPTSLPVTFQFQNTAIEGELEDSVALHYEWNDNSPNTNFNNAQLDLPNGGNASHAFANYGTYQIEQVVHNYTTGCSDSISLAVTISQLQAAFLLPDDTICKGDAISLFNQSTTWSAHPVNSWIYTFGNGQQINNGANVNYVYPASGSYNINFLVFNSAGCSSTATQTIFVANKPVAGLLAPTYAGCSPLPVSFSNTSYSIANGLPLATFNTVFSDNNASVTTTNVNQPINHTFTGNGVYTASITATDINGCVSNPVNVQITLTKPTALLTADTIICALDSSMISSLSTGEGPLSYQWFIGTNLSGSDSSCILNQAALGNGLFSTFPLSLVATDVNGCKDTIQQTIYISSPNAAPSFTFSGAAIDANGQYSCPPLFCDFTDQSTSLGSITNWNWTFGNGNASILQNPDNTLVTSGSFNLLLSVTDQYGCTDDTTINNYVTIGGPLGTPTWIQDNTICAQGALFTILNAANIDSVSWNLGNGIWVADSLSFPYFYPNTGTYNPSVTIYDTAGCQILFLLDPLTASVSGMNAQIAATPVYANINQVVNLSDVSTSLNPISTWTWMFPDSSNLFFQNTPQSIAFSQGGPQQIGLVITDNLGCIDTALITIFVSDPDIWVPNVFTPNGDGVNDIVTLPYPSFKSYDIQILNRWGNLVFELKDQTGIAVWDGYDFNGELHTDGVFFYRLRGEMLGGTLIDKHGFIHLVDGN
ncbi:MAG: PKD domain-containing protein [Crocinitomicaceae bacterium]|nr:PKD domain-containing protein [Crocinitomicaceae bacterium]